MLLDAAGIAVSTGSACTAGIPQPSHVLVAMGADEAVARSSLRFSLGWNSTQEDVTAVVEALPAVVAAGPPGGGPVPCGSSPHCPAGWIPRWRPPAWSMPVTR